MRLITEAGDVQHSDEVGGRLEGEALVHSLDHVIEEAAVHCLGQGVASVVRLFHLQRHPGEGKTKWSSDGLSETGTYRPPI